MSKITLKIGDRLTSFNPTHTSDVEDFKITGFNGGIIFRPSSNTQLHICSHWYVNGTKYATEDIAIPPTSFSHLKAGQWIKSLFDIGDRRKDKWYQVAGVSDLGGLIWYIMSGCNEVYNHDPLTWDLSDVRDEDPHIPKEMKAEVASGEYLHKILSYKEKKEMFEPITKDNIEDVLKYNNISAQWYSIDVDRESGDPWRISVTHPSDNRLEVETLFDSDYWIQYLEIAFQNELQDGKLNPLPKFDFETYIMKNIGSSIASEMMRAIAQSLTTRTKENADKIIEAYKILEGLK